MAGNSEKIDEIIDPAALKQVEDLKANLGELEKQFADTLKGAIALNNATGGAKTFSGYTQSATQATAATVKLQQIQDRAAITANQLKLSNAKLAEGLETIKNKSKLAAGEYAKLVASFNAATLAARNAGAEFGTQSNQFIDASAKVKVLRSELDAIDQPLGNYQRNVGNYGNAFVKFGQKAFGAIKTVANILPGIGLSGAFLLIFEGLKLVVEQFGLLEEGTSKYKDILASLNEVNGNASKQYGEQATNLKILYSAATDVNNSMESRLRAARELQKEFPDTFKNLKLEAILNGDSKGAYDSLTLSILENAKARAAVTKIQELQGKIQDIDFQNQKIENARVNETSNARLKAIKNQTSSLEFELKRRGETITEQGKQASKERAIQGVVTNLEPVINKRAADAKKLTEQNRGILQAQIDFLTKYAGGNNKLADALSTGDTPNKPKPKQAPDTRKQVLEQQLKDAKLSEEQILNNEKSSYDDRILAIADYEDKSSTLLAKATKDKIITHQEERNHFLEIDKDTLAKRIKIAGDAEKELLKLIKEGDKEQTEILKNSLETADRFTEANKANVQKNSDEALVALSEQYKKGLINTADYNRQKKDIGEQTDLDLQDAEITGLKLRISIENSLLEDDQKDKDKLAELEKKRSKTVAQQQIADAEEVAKRRQQLRDKEIELGNAVQDLAVSLGEAGFERRKNELQDQKNALDERTQAEIDAENRSLDSTSVKADKINIINAKAAAQKTVLDNKQKQADIAKAKFDKAVSIAKIIENTAQGITKTIAELGFPFATPFVAIAAALGAVQLATVIATPIPKYEKGTKSAKGGLSIWGEKGVELAIEPSGKMYTSPDTATFANIPRGTEIINNLELMRMIKAPQLKQKEAEQVPWKEVIKAIKQQKEVNVSPRISGWVRENAKQNKWDTYRKNHFN